MHSRRHIVRTNPPRLAGVPYANAALATLFDSTGRLRVPADLSTVQALVLLEMANFTQHLDAVQGGAYTGPPVRAGLALELARQLMVPREPPPGTPAAHNSAVERECLRRAMWLTYTLALMGYLYLGRRDAHQRRRCIDTNMRLPLDETTFELAELAGSMAPGEFCWRCRKVGV
jgi:hypothetical protein